MPEKQNTTSQAVNRKHITVFVGIIILTAILFFSLYWLLHIRPQTKIDELIKTNSLPPKQYQPTTISWRADLNIYENKKYGFTFWYSKKYRLQKSGGIDLDDSVGFQEVSSNLENSVAYVYVAKDYEVKSSPLLDNAIKYLTERVNYENIPVPKTSITQSKKVIYSNYYGFTTPYSVKGYELYFIHEMTERDKDKVKVHKELTGPYFIFDVTSQTKNTAIAIFGDIYSDKGIDIIRTFANSLRFKNSNTAN